MTSTDMPKPLSVQKVARLFGVPASLLRDPDPVKRERMRHHHRLYRHRQLARRRRNR